MSKNKNIIDGYWVGYNEIVFSTLWIATDPVDDTNRTSQANNNQRARENEIHKHHIKLAPTIKYTILLYLNTNTHRCENFDITKHF